MNALKVLDVSLRDGGHRTNFHFSREELKHIIGLLDKAGLDYIEIGYRNGSLHPIPDIGCAGLCEQDYLAYCRSLMKQSQMAVMVHPEKVSASDISELKQNGVDLIRICVIRGGVATACPVIDMVREYGMRVSVNFIHASQYQERELDHVVATAMKHQPDLIYFADSNGSLQPVRVQKIFQIYTQRYPAAFGFHAHDNLGLAQTNTLAAIEAGAQYVDASLAGMGKGTGNLKTEFFIAYLHACGLPNYDLDEVVAAANYVRRVLHIGQEELEMDEFIRGIADLSTAEMKTYNQRQTD
ncbi:4-hydroxy-2-oxovalerate aldolase [Legionella spiritensis]|uniref:4-hydroxy-2-oxovalerate aldolase n=1 Tax=Legionella spiritensis TaxID=452 RepID=UPI000F6D3228|nr:4-hydroxy-2-oxovalerate aldolase [Legionella spiritensis]VEG92055.1 4-hydroxy-2-ketovalerate aldolase [Legionella spiritensis]